jgi:hypothetical protein
MPMAAPVPMTVANPVAMTPVQMAVADQAAMAVMMPMAVAAMHLHEQVAFASGFRNGRLRCYGRRGNRSEQGSHSNKGRCQGHLRQHGFYSPRVGSSGVLDPQPFMRVDPELGRNEWFIRYSPRPHARRTKAGTVYALLTGISAGPTKRHQDAGCSALTPPANSSI